jgi:DNA-binding beta-propeller fold protein YncE
MSRSRSKAPSPGRGIAVALAIASALAMITAGAGAGLAAPLANGAAVPAADSTASVGLSGIPGQPAANQRTHTIYVPIQNSDVVDVINSATCNARVKTNCRVVARARVGRFGPGGGPLAVAVDPRTDTLYVVNIFGSPRGLGAVTVVNGARCNATDTRGCDHVLATVRVGKASVAALFSPRSRTLYVANAASNTISVINAAGCNALTQRSCSRRPRVLKDPGGGPDWLDVDLATGTLYAANGGQNGNGDTVSVFNAAACDARTGRGCGQVPRTVTVGSGPFGLAVDQASGAVYVANGNDGTISVINGAACNARVHTGCGLAPAFVTTGPSTGYVAVDPALHTAFAVSQGDDTISEINTRTCNGRVDTGCPSTARNERATFNPRHGFNPNAFALVAKTGTAYLVNVGGATLMSAVSVASCNAVTTRGCRVLPPSVPDHEFLMAADPGTGTLYASNSSAAQIDVINAATCNAADTSGCAPVATIPMAHPLANFAPGSIDFATHTLYAADTFSDTVSVIDTAACNAHHTTGCSATPPTVTVGLGPGPPEFDAATRTVYVPGGARANKVAVINAATCNATDTSGCTQTPAEVTVGVGTFDIAVSQATDTVYAPASGIGGNGHSHTVAVINGATCNGTNHAGCGHLAAVVKVGLNPFAVDVNDRTRTVYVSNNANGDLPGSVSMINEATCNGHRTTGCAAHHPVVTVGRSPELVAVDSRTDRIYVADSATADVSVINGARCNARRTGGCATAVRELPAGSIPTGIAIDDSASTLYVSLSFPSPNGPLALIKI